MPEPEDTINTPAGTDEVSTDTQETAPAETADNTPAGTEASEGADTQATEDVGQESFISPETKKNMDEQIARNPDLKPNLDNWHKMFQADYTRKRQQETKELKDLRAKAAIADRIQSDPGLVKTIQQYKAGGLKQDTPKAEATADVMEELMKDFAPEEKMLFNRLRPAMEKMIGQMIDPLQKTAAQTEEKTSLTELSADPDFAKIDVPTYWDDVKAIKGQYPAMPYKDALALAVGRDTKNVSSNLIKFGEEDAMRRTKSTTPAKNKAMAVAGGNGIGATQATSEDDTETSAEAFRRKHGIKVVG